MSAGDPIHAVIRGTGINSDGYTRAGISVPSGSAQEALIRSVYKKAQLDPRDTVYFEAHGTGTAVGDVVEVNAIARVFRPQSTSDQPEPEVKEVSHPLYLGSVKANIGHTEACAGLAGLIKAILVLQHEVIPPVPDLKSLKNGLMPPGCDIDVSTPRLINRKLPRPRHAKYISFMLDSNKVYQMASGCDPTSERQFLRLWRDEQYVCPGSHSEGSYATGNCLPDTGHRLSE